MIRGDLVNIDELEIVGVVVGRFSEIVGPIVVACVEANVSSIVDIVY